MPELGSKISLISKADIRYEGRLFTVDPTECTIALANVRSFGTEDRETQYPIAPQSQIYDYILFRGSDIKDIRVVNNGMPHPNDPAIMQMQLPNGQPMMPHFPMPAAMNAPMGNYGNPFGTMGGLGGLGAAGLAPGSFMLNKPKQPTSLIDLLTGASRSTTPVSLISRKSPSADMGVQVNQTASNAAGGNRDVGYKRQNQQQKNIGTVGQRDRKDSGKMDHIQHHNQHHHQDNRNHHRNNQNNQNRGWINRGSNMNNMRGGNRGRGRMQNQGGGGGTGGYRQGGGNPNKSTRPPKNTIKFEQDYDFEQANSKFEELRSQLSKLKVGDDAKAEQVNGETDKKDDSGNETGAGEHEQEEEEIVVGYDKTKSFFDNISCEAADRSKGKNRTDWRQERKLNSETFGIPTTRRGNYRGRTGGYYNRNSYNRGYRGGNYRGRNSNNINNRGGQQSTGLPNKSIQQPQQQQQQQQPQQQSQQNQSSQQSQPQSAEVTVAGK